MNVMAYIDGATSAIIFQVLAGAGIALAVVFTIWWRKITTFFRSVWCKIFGKKQKDDETTVKTEEEKAFDEEIAETDDAVDTTDNK